MSIGYAAMAASILGRESLDRADHVEPRLPSALLGSVGGFLATGTALYLTGRHSIDREINEDRAQLSVRYSTVAPRQASTSSGSPS